MPRNLFSTMKVAIGITVGGVVIVLIVVVVSTIYRRRLRKRKLAANSSTPGEDMQTVGEGLEVADPRHPSLFQKAELHAVDRPHELEAGESGVYELDGGRHGEGMRPAETAEDEDEITVLPRVDPAAARPSATRPK